MALTMRQCAAMLKLSSLGLAVGPNARAGLEAPLRTGLVRAAIYFIAASNISPTWSQFTKWSKNALR